LPSPGLDARGIFEIIARNLNPLILQPTAWLPRKILQSIDLPALPIPILPIRQPPPRFPGSRANILASVQVQEESLNQSLVLRSRRSIYQDYPQPFTMIIISSSRSRITIGYQPSRGLGSEPWDQLLPVVHQIRALQQAFPIQQPACTGRLPQMLLPPRKRLKFRGKEDKKLLLLKLNIEEPVDPPDKGHVPHHQPSSTDVLDVRFRWGNAFPVIQVLARRHPPYAVILDSPVSMPSLMLSFSPHRQGDILIALPELLLHGSVLVLPDRAQKKNFKMHPFSVPDLLRTWVRSGFTRMLSASSQGHPGEHG